MILVIAMSCFRLIVAALRKSLRVRTRMSPTFLLISALGTISTPLSAGPELKMSVVVNQETTWGLAAQRFADAIKYRTQGRVQSLFGLPFMFPSYTALDAVEAGEPGTRLFKLIEQQGAVPIAWAENGFREVTNSKRPIHRPEDLQGLTIRVPPIPILVEIFQAPRKSGHHEL